MRKLMLKKETLVDLSVDELTGVVAAGPTLKVGCGPTLSLICRWSEVDACITAQGCAQ